MINERTAKRGRNLNDPKVWQELTKKEEPKKEPEKPRVVVDVYRGDKHVQELFK
jgi:Trm5-related predicted tRNA methylase